MSIVSTITYFVNKFFVTRSQYDSLLERLEVLENQALERLDDERLRPSILKRLQRRVSALEGQYSDITDYIDEFDADEFESMQQSIADLENTFGEWEPTFEDLPDRFDGIEDTIAEVEKTFEDFEESISMQFKVLCDRVEQAERVCWRAETLLKKEGVGNDSDPETPVKDS